MSLLARVLPLTLLVLGFQNCTPKSGGAEKTEKSSSAVYANGTGYAGKTFVRNAPANPIEACRDGYSAQDRIRIESTTRGYFDRKNCLNVERDDIDLASAGVSFPAPDKMVVEGVEYNETQNPDELNGIYPPPSAIKFDIGLPTPDPMPNPLPDPVPQPDPMPQYGMWRFIGTSWPYTGTTCGIDNPAGGYCLSPGTTCVGKGGTTDFNGQSVTSYNIFACEIVP